MSAPTLPGNAARRPRIIGLTGGIAAGKSTVAKLFADLGAVVIDADAIAREMLYRPEVVEAIRRHWGGEVFAPDGRPSRERVAAKVFRDPERLRELTSWVHPPTLEEMRHRMEKALADAGTPLIILDVPLLLEGELHHWCDAVAFVEARQAQRAQRARETRGWDEGELDRREALQKPIAEKRHHADKVIDNGGTLEATRAQVERLFQEWTRSST